MVNTYLFIAQRVGKLWKTKGFWTLVSEGQGRKVKQES